MLRKKRDKLVLVGGGGHALSLIEAFQDPDAIIGYTAPAMAANMPLDWLGDDSVSPILRENHKFHIAFVYAGLPLMDKRRRIIETYENFGADFFSIIADSAIVTRNASVADGCAILNRAVVNRASLGRHVVVNTGAIVEHDCEIGSNSFIGPGAVLGGAVKVGRDCFIGLGARLKNGISIAPDISIGMGAVVSDSLSEPGIYHGNPLRFHPLKKIKK